MDIWTPEMTTVLLQAVCTCKPIGSLSLGLLGLHKHFRIIYIARFINNNMGTNVTTDQLWAKLDTLYDLNALDELVDSLYLLIR
jgi:hypothetical protein